MGVDYALACGDCLEFMDLHKWSILEDAGRCLIAAHGLSHYDYQSFEAQRVPSLSSQPLVPVTAQQLVKALHDFVPHHSYIEELLPFVHSFMTAHQDHFLFFTCDIGERPWCFGEPRCYEWREIWAAFNFDSQFLPKNLVKDFNFHYWEEVLEHYSKRLSW